MSDLERLMEQDFEQTNATSVEKIDQQGLVIKKQEFLILSKRLKNRRRSF